MAYRVEYSKAALRQLKKMDRFDAHLLTSWIGKTSKDVIIRARMEKV